MCFISWTGAVPHSVTHRRPQFELRGNRQNQGKLERRTREKEKKVFRVSKVEVSGAQEKR